MKNKEKIVKVRKKIDIEGLVYNATFAMNLVALVGAIVNGIFIHNTYISCFVIGWCIALIIINTIVSIAGHKNFKEDIEQLKWLMDNIDVLEAKEAELNGKKKLQRSRR